MTVGVAPCRRESALVPALPTGQPLQADLFGASGAQVDLWGVWWSPAGRARRRPALLAFCSAGVVTPAERTQRSTGLTRD